MSAIDPAFAANFTIRYGDYLNPMPEVNSFREFMRLVPPTDRAGKEFHYPIQSAISHGQTLDITGTAYALNAARSPAQLEAVLDGCDIALRETLPYSAMLKGNNGASKSGDSAAYWQPFDYIMMTLLRGAEHYNELALMYGPGPGATIASDIGVIATTAVFAGTGPNFGSATHPIVQITRASWASGLWNNSGSGGNATGGMLVDILNAAGTATVETNVQVEGVVDPQLCQVQMFKTGSAVAVAAGQRILPAGWYNKCCLGTQGILQNTGTFAGISAATNPIWRARQFPIAGAMTRARVLQIAAKLFPNGLKKGLVAFANSQTFADLAEETHTLTRWNESSGQGVETKVQGTTKLTYISPVGQIEVRVHEFMKQGAMFFLEPDMSVRVGASDINFRGADGRGELFLELPNNAGSELRCISQQAPLLLQPYRNAIATGITNTGDDTSGS
jgi:hypothetical protein